MYRLILGVLLVAVTVAGTPAAASPHGEKEPRRVLRCESTRAARVCARARLIGGARSCTTRAPKHVSVAAISQRMPRGGAVRAPRLTEEGTLQPVHTNLFYTRSSCARPTRKHLCASSSCAHRAAGSAMFPRGQRHVFQHRDADAGVVRVNGSSVSETAGPIDVSAMAATFLREPPVLLGKTTLNPRTGPNGVRANE